MKKGIAISVNGRVQGVGYRRFVKNAAKKYNIQGSVENQMDGSVFISAEGLPEDIELFAEKCRKGPIWAVVIDFTIINTESLEQTSFDIF